MSISGICEAVKVMYTRNTVPHLLFGKADSRANWGHQLLDLALNTILLEDVLPELDVDFCALKNLCKI